jgi:hypothetical protein
MMQESTATAVVFAVILLSGLIGAAAAVWFEIRRS